MKRSHLHSRRDLVKLAGLSVASCALGSRFPNVAMAADATVPPATALTPLNRFPRMVQEYFVERVRAVERAAQARRDALRTREDAEAYVREVRGKIQQCFGPWPGKTPLNARVTGVIERDAYTIEKVIFESRPNFPVTANLYLPKHRAAPVPGVIGECGHSANGKAHESYQSFAQGLARLGHVCLIFDPIGQGERLQYVTPDLKPRRGTGTTEHRHAGEQQFLVGGFFGAWRAWDAIRALDYLLTRPEVDATRVGITGNSGGGTMTTWHCGVEPRFTMAAPSCFVTTFRRNLENELPADTEQCPPRVLALGLDHADFIAAMAPKPVVLLGQERDFFDARGIEETHARLRRLYALLGAEAEIGLSTGPGDHGYSRENREAMSVAQGPDAIYEPYGVMLSEDEGRTWSVVKDWDQTVSAPLPMLRLRDGSVLGMSRWTWPQADGSEIGSTVRWIADLAQFTAFQSRIRLPGEYHSERVPLTVERHVFENADGSLLMAGYSKTGPSTPEGLRASRRYSHLVRSTDGGKTWEHSAVIGAGGEPAVARLGGGKMTALLRTGPFKPFHQVFSDDDGKTWSAPVLTEEGSVCPDLVPMSNGLLACSYGRPASCLMFSADGGKTWSSHHVISEKTGFNYTGIVEVRPGRLLYLHDGGGLQALTIDVERQPE